MDPGPRSLVCSETQRCSRRSAESWLEAREGETRLRACGGFLEVTSVYTGTSNPAGKREGAVETPRMKACQRNNLVLGQRGHLRSPGHTIKCKMDYSFLCTTSPSAADLCDPFINHPHPRLVSSASVGQVREAGDTHWTSNNWTSSTDPRC